MYPPETLFDESKDRIIAWARRHPFWFALPMVILPIAIVTYRILQPEEFQHRFSLQIPTKTESFQFPLKLNDGSDVSLIASLFQTNAVRKAAAEPLRMSQEELLRRYAVDRNEGASRITVSFRHKEKDKAFQVLQAALKTASIMRRDIKINRESIRARLFSEAAEKAEVSLRLAKARLTSGQKNLKSGLKFKSNPESLIRSLTEIELELQGLNAKLKIVEKQVRDSASRPFSGPTDARLAYWKQLYQEKSLALATLEIEYGKDAPQVNKARQELELVRKKGLAEAEDVVTDIDQKINPEIATLYATKVMLETQRDAVKSIVDRAPEEANKLSELEQEVQVQGMLYQELRLKAEQAKVEEQVEDVAWVVLEPPYREEEPESKKLAVNGIGALALGFLCSSSLALLLSRKKPGG